MKRTATLSTLSIAALVMSLGMPLSATAATSEEPLEDAVAAAFQEELERLAVESGAAMTFDDVVIDLSTATLAAADSTDPAVIAEYLVDESEVAAEIGASALAPVRAPAAAPPKSMLSTTATKTQNYTADQGSGVPALGISWVNQDMSVTFTGNTINSVRLIGNSYGTGVSVFAYTHISTSLEYRLNRTCLYTRMKGTFSAIVKGSFASFAATGLATDAPRGGRMVSLSYWQC